MFIKKDLVGKIVRHQSNHCWNSRDTAFFHGYITVNKIHGLGPWLEHISSHSHT